jgi:hypothetical protein
MLFENPARLERNGCGKLGQRGSPMPNHKSSSSLSLLTLVMVFLFGYIATYYMMARVNRSVITLGGSAPNYPTYYIPGYDRMTREQWEAIHRPLELIFCPVHWLDCKLRPNVWK